MKIYAFVLTLLMAGGGVAIVKATADPYPDQSYALITPANKDDDGIIVITPDQPPEHAAPPAASPEDGQPIGFGIGITSHCSAWVAQTDNFFSVWADGYWTALNLIAMARSQAQAGAEDLGNVYPGRRVHKFCLQHKDMTVVGAATEAWKQSVAIAAEALQQDHEAH